MSIYNVYALFDVNDKSRVPLPHYRYVGQTSIGTAARLQRHFRELARGYPVYRWIEEVGQESIRAVTLGAYASKADAEADEEVWRSRLGSEGHELLNCWTGGGSAGRTLVSDETRKKFADGSRGHYISPEGLARIVASNNNRTVSAETKAKIGAKSRAYQARVRAEREAATNEES
jgi:hypothetical protein